MPRLWRFGSLLRPMVMLVVCSCSIIEDSDIQSEEDLDELDLKAIEISQETHNGNKISKATLQYDSVQNFVDQSTGVKIVRKIGFKMTDLGNLKLKLRSGTSGDTESYMYYKEGGQPYTFGIVKGDSVVELYRFRYDGSNRLSKINTIINPIDGLPGTVFTNDSMVYTGANITSIVRKSPFDPSKAANINIEYGGSGDFQSVSSFVYLGNNYQQSQGNCSNSSNFESCAAMNIQPNQGGGGSGTFYTIQTNPIFNRPGQIILIDDKFNSNNGRDFDTYYLHPVVLLKNELSLGKFLATIYCIDWVVPGPQLSGGISGSNLRETVRFSFEYGN